MSSTSSCSWSSATSSRPRRRARPPSVSRGVHVSHHSAWSASTNASSTGGRASTKSRSTTASSASRRYGKSCCPSTTPPRSPALGGSENGVSGNAVATAIHGAPCGVTSRSLSRSLREYSSPWSRGGLLIGRPFCSQRPFFTSTLPPFTSSTRIPRSGTATTKSPSPSTFLAVRMRSECHAVQPTGSDAPRARWSACSARLVVGRGAPRGKRPVGGTPGCYRVAPRVPSGSLRERGFTSRA